MKLLIVDDDPVVVFVQKKILQSIGYPEDIFEFKDGQEALEFLQGQDLIADPLLILLDINMPRLNGWEFLDSIQLEDFATKLKVVMVSSSIDPSDQNKSKTYPQVIDYISKPLEIERCKQVLELAVQD